MNLAIRATLVAALLCGCGSGDKPTEQPDNAPPPTGLEAPSFDVTTVVAPARLPVSPEVKVGWRAKQKIDAGGTILTQSWAVVGETADAWLIEHTDISMASYGPEVASMLMGLTVKKEDGRVVQAVIGRPGEAGRAIKVSEPTPEGAAEVRTEDVKIKLGTYPALRRTKDGITTWTGNGGEHAGVLLRSEGQGQDFELSEFPEESEVKVEGTALTVSRFTYSNGKVEWLSTNPILATFCNEERRDGRGLFKQVDGAVSREIVELGTDARPQLKW